MREVPIPSHFDPEKAGEVYRVPYGERARDADVLAVEGNLDAVGDGNGHAPDP